MQYNGGTGDGGGGGDPAVTVGSTDPSPQFTFVPSNYQFTDPPRYFKANDPYYYEVDNIPLKQLHENCLWLRDQMTGIELNVTGVPLSQVIDLQPVVNNADRVVTVRPGRFTARINDAYGSTEFFSTQESGQPLVDIARTPVYLLSPIIASNPVFQTIMGATLENLFYGNGLYNELQHHAAKIELTNPTSDSYPLQITFNPTYLNSGDLDLTDLPKIKHAVWKQISSQPDLQQRAVDFTRRWQGVSRTAVVNVPNDLSVEIPPFSADDFLDVDTNEYDPQVRIDLVFLYSHPIDSAITYIAKKTDLGSPESIVTPRIGVVKGAGALLGPRNGALNITGGEGIGDSGWINQQSQSDKFYDTSGALEPGVDLAIQAPMSDQAMLGVTNPPFPGKTTGLSFPSPDDLLNLAPIISEEALQHSLVTIGQSVLPICYVIVKKDAPIIFDVDIIDIRPFLRTTELAYNERAGIGAANPPLSLANPPTGKAEVYAAIQQLRELLEDRFQGILDSVNDSLDGIPMPLPYFTAQYYKYSGYGSPTALTMQTYSTANNPPEGVGTGLYTGLNGGAVYLPGGTDYVDIIPGKYLIEGTVDGMMGANGAGYGQYNVALYDDGVKLWPDEQSVESAVRFQTFRYESDDNFRQSNGSISFSTILTLFPAPEGDPVTTRLMLKVDEIGTGASIYARGTLKIERIGNADGTTGMFPGEEDDPGPDPFG